MTLYTCDISAEKALLTLAVVLEDYWETRRNALERQAQLAKWSLSRKVFRIDITVTEDTGAAGNFRSGDGGE